MAKVNWNLDPSHSEVTFKVKHLMISNVTGKFTEFSLEASSDEEDFTKGEVTFKAKAASVDTGNEQRDGHLKSQDFFDAEKFPELVFKSSGIENLSKDGSFDITGDFTIKGVTKKVTFKGEFGGVQKDPWGNVKAGFSINGKIDRKEFGLTWNAPIEAGGLLVGEEVKIACEFELSKA